MKEDSKKGVFIPQEIIDDDRLNIYEVMLLSYYKYYTEYGKLKCCKKTNDEILGELKKLSKRTLFRCKSHLIELGYIETKGIEVRYLGLGNTTEADTTKVKDKEDKTEKPQKPTMTIDYMGNKSLLFAYFYEEEYKTKK